MLVCHACIRKTIRIVLGDVVDVNPILRRYQRWRFIAGSAQLPQPWARRTMASSAPTVERAGTTALMHLYTEQKRKAIASRLNFNETSLREELRYLKDPLKLANYISSLLEKNGFEKALELVRMACKTTLCTVSWNHLIDAEMYKGRVSGAVKLYNEMKKRAQVPDARTYTLLFRGFAAHPEYPHSLSRALAIYQSMFAEQCPVKPSIIHTNAVLKVCARALDVDALLGVAAKLPTRGAGAPNNLTFTTIMNAIRSAAWENRVGSFEERVRSRRQATDQGRRIWGEVVGRWRKGDIVVDEEMVCAMGRLLLLGYKDHDCDDVLSLVEQTMGIPRQAPRVEKGKDEVLSAQRRYKEQARQLPAPQSDHPTSEGSLAVEIVSRAESEGETDITGSEFDSVNSPNMAHARAGPNTLSMVLDACIRLYAFRPAQDYWGLLTDPDGQYNVIPDAENYHMYLRLLRAQRASKLCVELVEEMRYDLAGKASFLQPKTFRIALSTCVRDTKNPNVLQHADRLIRIMLDSLEKPDLKTLDLYLDVAMSHENRDWKSLMRVLRSSAISVRNLRSYLTYGEETEKVNWQRQHEEDLIRFVRRLVGAYDTALVMGQGQMQQEETKYCQEQRNTLTAWVSRKTQGRMKWEKKLRNGNEDERKNSDEQQGGGRDEERSFDQGEGSTDTADRNSGRRDGRLNSFRTGREGHQPNLDGKDPSRSHRSPPATEAGEAEGTPWKRFQGNTYRPSLIFQNRVPEGGARKRRERAQTVLAEGISDGPERW